MTPPQHAKVLDALSDLDGPVARTLTEFVAAAERALGADLKSIVLFGSAAENRLRATSDVNVIIVLTRFAREQIDVLSDAVLAGRAAIRLNVMWLLDAEIADAVEAFAVKFGDIARRHRVLWGTDPFATVSVPRRVAIARLKQVLLNLVLRLRANYALYSGREERLAALATDAAGPLRACAAEILELETSACVPPREALEQAVRTARREDLAGAVDALSEARKTGAVVPGTGAPLVLALSEIANHLLGRVKALDRS